MRIDPDGMADDWYESASGNITWTDCKSQQGLDANGIKGTYLGQAVAVFEGSQNEKLGKGNNLFGEGAVLAKATIYGPNGVDDIKEYDAFTMSSDFSTFGAIDNGTYTVNYRNPGKGGQLKSNWAVNNTMPVDCLDGKNPNPIEGYSKTQKNGIYIIHSSNRDGFAGKYYHKNGDILLYPFVSIFPYCSSIISIPPTPADTITPTSSALVSSILKLASSRAIFVAAKAN